jgi:hypothetical protein
MEVYIPICQLPNIFLSEHPAGAIALLQPPTNHTILQGNFQHSGLLTGHVNPAGPIPVPPHQATMHTQTQSPLTGRVIPELLLLPFLRGVYAQHHQVAAVQPHREGGLLLQGPLAEDGGPAGLQHPDGL